MTFNQTKPTDKGNKKNRRDFLNILLGGGFLAWFTSLLFPVFKYLDPPEIEEVKVSSVKIGSIDELEKDSGKIIKFGNKPVIVVRNPNGDVVAFSAVCTHLDCIVQYKKEYGQIYCACHNGRFDLNGRNVSGPPPYPLKKYGVTLKDKEVIIHEEAS